jgi:PAS domain S-box-containing protein
LSNPTPKPPTPATGDRWEEDRALRAILEGTARATGNEFFRALVNQLASVLRVRYSIVTELLPDRETLRTLAYWDRDHFLDNVDYPVRDTPCEGVVNGEICHFPSHLQESFPSDQELARMAAVSYFGVPLFDNDKQVVGHLAVLDTEPMPTKPRVQTILEIFAARASAELVGIRAQEALRESEASFRQLTEEIQEVFWLIQVDKGDLIYLSPAFERIWGRSCQSVYDDPHAWTAGIHPADRERVVTAFTERAAQGTFEEEYRIVRPDGSVRWIRDRGFPVRNKDGEVYRVAGIATDITKQKIDLSGKLLAAQEEERRRLARELHDDVTQRLAMLALETGRLEQQLRPVSERVGDQFREMKNRIVQLSEDIHGISRRLHPAILDDLGLVEAIRSQCNSFEDNEGTPVEFTAENVPEEIYKDVAFCLYRITQESLRNISKHADAKGVSVALLGRNKHLELTIEDTGIGFEHELPPGHVGLGLASMAERVRLVQGTINVRSSPGEGTRIQVTTPLTRRAV